MDTSQIMSAIFLTAIIILILGYSQLQQHYWYIRPTYNGDTERDRVRLCRAGEPALEFD